MDPSCKQPSPNIFVTAQVRANLIILQKLSNVSNLLGICGIHLGSFTKKRITRSTFFGHTTPSCRSLSRYNGRLAIFYPQNTTIDYTPVIQMFAPCVSVHRRVFLTQITLNVKCNSKCVCKNTSKTAKICDKNLQFRVFDPETAPLRSTPVI